MTEREKKVQAGAENGGILSQEFKMAMMATYESIVIGRMCVS